MSSSKGFSLAETIIAIGVLTTGVLGAAGILAAGMQNLSSSPGDVIVTQKAAQAIEAVFSARDSHKLQWSQIRNVNATPPGIFLAGPQPLKLAGADGLVNTADDTTVETVTFPGKDQKLLTSDDWTFPLSTYTREIVITDLPGETDVRKVVVNVTFKNGTSTRKYTLTTFISSYS
jgi:type II secretory pathway pseudopilin PulG